MSLDRQQLRRGALLLGILLVAALALILQNALTLSSLGGTAGSTTVAVRGSANAPVTIVEYSDFQCPFCGRFFKQTLPQLEQQYLDTGKAKLLYKDFPLGFHQHAQKAAEAGKCALAQGKFWPLHDKIFENQQALSVENLKKWADQLGLDMKEFNDCLDSGRMAAKIQAESAEGRAAGVKGTPTFVISGPGGSTTVVGAQPFAAIQVAIEKVS